MDLYNNNAGRQMALDPRNRDRPPEEVILEALRAGRLQTRPYSTAQGEETEGWLQGPGQYAPHRLCRGHARTILAALRGPSVKGARDPRRR